MDVIDLGALPYKKYVETVINHRVSEEHPWYFGDAYEVICSDYHNYVDMIIKSFDGMNGLEDDFGQNKIDQYIWFLSVGPVGMLEIFSEKIREESLIYPLIHAIERLYTDYVTPRYTDTVPTSFYMFPDGISSAVSDADLWFHINENLNINLIFKLEERSRVFKMIEAWYGQQPVHIQTAIDQLENMYSRVLNVTNFRVQRCALHGLGHLHSTHKLEIIESFIRRENVMDLKYLQWLYKCQLSVVM